jgi:hypothetical protein
LLKEEAQMADYLIETTHRPDECLKNLDEMRASGRDILATFEFGCGHQVHKGWGFRKANSEEEALEVVPRFARDRARATEVKKYTEAEIEKIHGMHK